MEYSEFLKKGNPKVITTIRFCRKLNLRYAKLLFGFMCQNTGRFCSYVN